MSVQWGTARTAFGDHRIRGQVAVDNRTARGGASLSVLSGVPYAHAVAECWLSGDELRALRDHLTALLTTGRA